MNEEPLSQAAPPAEPTPPQEAPHQPVEPPKAPDAPTSSNLRQSTLYRLCEEMIALRERSDRQHREFEKSLGRTQTTFQTAFNTFAADTQRAYQQLRQELAGEKRTTLALLNELLDVAIDLETIVAARPGVPEPDSLFRWSESVDVHLRKVRDALARFGIHPFDAAVGSPYNPALHERVEGRKVEGMEPSRVVEQQQRGFASQQPDFVLRRPRVVVSD